MTGRWMPRTRHCERSEAIHGSARETWIASSLTLLAMTMVRRLGQDEAPRTRRQPSASAADAFHHPVELPVLGVDPGVAVVVPRGRGCVRSGHSRAVGPK